MRWSTLLPILSVHFLGTLGYSIAIPFLVFVVLDLGGAAWTYGLVGALYSTFQLIGAPLMGRWSDRSGRRVVLVASQAGTFAAWMLFITALWLPIESLGSVAGATVTIPLLLVALARSLDGLTGGNVSVASAWVADLTVGQEADRQVAFGRMGMAASLGMVIGPALAGLLGGTTYGHMGPVAVAAVLSGVAALATVLLLPDPPQRCPVGPPQQPTVSEVMGQQLKRCDRVEPKAPARLLWRSDIRRLLLGTFVMFLGFNFFYASFPVHATTTLGWEAGTMGAFFALMAAAMLPAQGPLLAAASRRLPSTTVFALGGCCLAGAFVVFALPYPPAPFVGAVLFAIGNGLAWPTFQTRIAQVAGDDQGAVQGAATSAGSLASILGLLLGGVLYPAVGVGLFAAIAVVFGAVVLGTPLWFSTQRDPIQ